MCHVQNIPMSFYKWQKTRVYQFCLTSAALFLLTALQKRLFATLHILTKYSDSSMKWGSHIVDTPTATVNETDYSQIFDNINFMLRPRSGGQLSLQMDAWKILPSKHTLDLQRSWWVVAWVITFHVWEQTGTMAAPWLECQRHFLIEKMTWMHRKDPESNDA